MSWIRPPQVTPLPMRALVSCDFVDQAALRCFFAGAADVTRSAVEMHLATCPRCRRKVQLFERVWRWDRQRRAARQDGLSVPDDVATMSGLLS
jgi:hypothetical protein